MKTSTKRGILAGGIISRLALLCTGVVAFSAGSFAIPLTITYSGADSGTIGGTPFPNASFTITERLDTANRQAFSLGGNNGFIIDDQSASISISGVGVFSFITPNASFVNNTSQSAGFSAIFPPNNFELVALNDAAFATWDMTTSLGPIISGQFIGEIEQFNSPSLPPGGIQTSGGRLVLDDQIEFFTPNITFQAVATPEPGLFILTGACLMGLGLIRLHIHSGSNQIQIMEVRVPADHQPRTVDLTPNFGRLPAGNCSANATDTPFSPKS